MLQCCKVNLKSRLNKVWSGSIKWQQHFCRVAFFGRSFLGNALASSPPRIILLPKLIFRLQSSLSEDGVKMSGKKRPKFLPLLLIIVICLSEVLTRKCKIVPLKHRSRINADTVFAGRVGSYLVMNKVDLNGKAKPWIFAAKVRIKRVFKNQEISKGQSVLVEGLGNPRLSSSKPKIGKTLLFFVNRKRNKELGFRTFKLRSSLLRPTKLNLKELSRLLQLNQNNTGESKVET